MSKAQCVLRVSASARAYLLLVEVFEGDEEGEDETGIQYDEEEEGLATDQGEQPSGAEVEASAAPRRQPLAQHGYHRAPQPTPFCQIDIVEDGRNSVFDTAVSETLPVGEPLF